MHWPGAGEAGVVSRVPAGERVSPQPGSRADHSRGGEALRTRVLGERARISRLSRIRELVLGFQDGQLVPPASSPSLAGASAGATVIIIGGVAEAAAGALAMGIAGIGLSLVAMAFAAAGVITPVVGALLQEAIDVAVIANALRALRA